jgi:hypothetical protein
VLISLRIRPPRANIGFAECSAQIRPWSRSSAPDEDGSLWPTSLVGAASTNTGAAHTPSHLIAEQTLTTCLLHKTVGRPVQFTVDPGLNIGDAPDVSGPPALPVASACLEAV